MKKGLTLPRLFGERIAVVVRSNEVVFRSSERVLTLSPFLFLKGDRIESVGMPSAEVTDRVEVFAAHVDRANRIAKFFAYGLHETLGRTFAVKPIIQLSVETTDISVTEVRDALLAAGAAEVVEEAAHL